MTEQTLARKRNHRNDLSQEYLRSILDYDPETGIFRWKWRSDVPNNINGKCAGKVAGKRDPIGDRLFIRINAVSYLAHRLAWLYMTGEWPEEDIDHEDCDSMNNKFSNLRSCTHTQNCANTRGRSGRCGLKGVSYMKQKGKYRARINMGGTEIHLGLFLTPEEAHEAYCAAVYKFHGEFARTG